MKVVDTPAAVRGGSGQIRGLVPTMGYFHEGHLSLMRTARDECDQVVVSVFVNPLQFDDPADLERYPRDLDRDLALAEEAGVDVVFAPTVDVMYPRPPFARIMVDRVADEMEGRFRAGHFTGVATVVAKLFAALQPDRSYFGRKDHQQLAVIRAMAADLSFPTEVVGCPTLREPDGLALSSRNVFIDDRPAALTISRSLMAAAGAVESGERGADALEELVRDGLALDSVDYVTLASQEAATPLDEIDEPAFLAVAGRVGEVRLIDNLPVDLVDGVWTPDRGIRLSEPSGLANL